MFETLKNATEEQKNEYALFMAGYIKELGSLLALKNHIIDMINGRSVTFENSDIDLLDNAQKIYITVEIDDTAIENCDIFNTPSTVKALSKEQISTMIVSILNQQPIKYDFTILEDGSFALTKIYDVQLMERLSIEEKLKRLEAEENELLQRQKGAQKELQGLDDEDEHRKEKANSPYC
ncbi:MAG: hypothetical protein ACK5WS_02160 [Alphaproteobacteria bacterium]|jgi:hypothetical protein|nr:hypothetical protein [Candidatus Jidaibacter sp.]